MSTPSKQYEFDERQNEVIKQLWQAMRWVAVPLLLIGIIYLIGIASWIGQAIATPRSAFPLISLGLAALFFGALAIWTRRAASGFQQVTETAGQDIEHLMAALDNLRKAFSLLSLVVKIYVALLIIGIIVALILPLMR